MQLLDYAPIAVLTVLALVVAGVIILLSYIADRPRHSRTMTTPYECGVPALGNARERFSVKFYLVAVLFILFDVEVVFMYPWAVSFGSTTVRGDAPSTALLLWEVLAFVVILFLGWAYVIKKGVLEWHKED